MRRPVNLMALISGLVFIAVGVVFLLDRLGVVVVPARFVIPVLLVGLGIGLIFGRREVGGPREDTRPRDEAPRREEVREEAAGDAPPPPVAPERPPFAPGRPELESAEAEVSPRPDEPPSEPTTDLGAEPRSEDERSEGGVRSEDEPRGERDS